MGLPGPFLRRAAFSPAQTQAATSLARPESAETASLPKTRLFPGDDCCLVGVLYEERAIQIQSIWCAGLSGLARSSNHTNQTNQIDQRDQMSQIPATPAKCWIARPDPFFSLHRKGPRITSFGDSSRTPECRAPKACRPIFHPASRRDVEYVFGPSDRWHLIRFYPLRSSGSGPT